MEADRPRVAVIGAGNVGRSLAAGWVRAGYEVAIGSRDPDGDAGRVASSVGAVATTREQAAADAEVVVFTVPGAAMPDAVACLAAARADVVVVDATNGRVDGSPSPSNAQAVVVGAAPAAHYVRAFNSTSWENMGNPVVDGLPVDMLWCGPDGDVATTVTTLIASLGLRPVRVGGTDLVAALDGLTALWFALAFAQGHGRQVAFRACGLTGPGTT